MTTQADARERLNRQWADSALSVVLRPRLGPRQAGKVDAELRRIAAICPDALRDRASKLRAAADMLDEYVSKEQGE